MMEDWTDIIGGELENIEELLPADDWSALQQKYAASQRRKKAVAFAWAGGITSVAASLALCLVVSRPDPLRSYDDFVADVLPPSEMMRPVDPISAVCPDDSKEDVPEKKQNDAAAVVRERDEDIMIAQNVPAKDACETSVAEEQVFNAVKDTASVTEKLIADACQPSGTFGYEDFPEDKPVRKGRKISFGVSGSASRSPMRDGMILNENMSQTDRNPGFSDPPEFGDNRPGGDPLPPEEADPGDSSAVATPASTHAMMRKKASYDDTYRHEIPKSFGISARFFLTERLSVNTGLYYTVYASDRTRKFSDFTTREDRQYVHYLGIPVRLDWVAVSGKRFNFYLGAGIQADKCVYATVGGERLHEKQVLFGMNAALGAQFNITPSVGLYFEPDVSYSMNEGSIETYRSKEPFVITVRGGLRFSF